MAKKVFTNESLATFVDEVKSYADGAASTKANATHTHTISDVDNLQTILNSKSDSAHNHDSNYAALNHTHGDIYYTETEIDSMISTINSSISGKANSSHTHTIANISNLQSELDTITDAIDGKAASSHTHSDYSLTTHNHDSNYAAINHTHDYAASSHTHSAASTTADGMMSVADKIKLNGIATGAEVNQNAFSNVVVGDVAVAADNKTDSITFAGSNVTVTPDATNDKITFGITKANVTSALGYTPPTQDTTYSAAGSSLGLVKSGGDVTISGGVITVNDDSHNHTIANVDGLQDVLDAKAASGHTHSAYANQNAFSNVVIGSTTIAADSTTDTLTLVGSNVTLTPDATNDKVTISITKDNVTNALGYTPPTSNTTYSEATQSAAGLMSVADKTKLDSVTSGAEPNQNAFSNVTIGSTTIAADGKTDTLTLAGSNVTLTPDATNDKITIGITKANVTSALGYTPPTTNTTYSNATTSAAGLMSAGDKSKLDGVATGAEVNQNAFSNVVVGSTTIAADGKTDSLTLVGSNVTLTPDATNDKVTIGITKSNVTTALGYTPPTQDTTYSVATQSANGLMSASDKTKLDGVATGANNYSLPTATSSVLGGVKTGSNITNTSGTISLTKANVTSALGYTPPTTNTTYSAATTSAAGLMSASDKSKLDGIAAGANKYTLPTAGSSLGGVKTTSTVTSTSGYTACPIISGVPYYKDTNTTYSLSSFGITATAAELNYVDGVTSDIQIQLDSKAASSHTHNYLPLGGGTMTGNIVMSNNKSIINVDESGNQRAVVLTNTSGGTHFGSGSYDASDGTVYYSGNTVQIRSKQGTYFVQAPIYSSQDLTFNDNGAAIYGTDANGNVREVFNPQNTEGNVVIGKGGYDASSGGTNIYGKNVNVATKDSSFTVDGIELGHVDNSTCTLASGWSQYASGDTINVYRYGKIAYVTGAIKNNSAMTINNNKVQIFTVPSGYRPVDTVQVVCQGSGVYRWMLTIDPNGVAYAQRYGATGYVEASAGSWFPFSATWIIS